MVCIVIMTPEKNTPDNENFVLQKNFSHYKVIIVADRVDIVYVGKKETGRPIDRPIHSYLHHILACTKQTDMS